MTRQSKILNAALCAVAAAVLFFWSYPAVIKPMVVKHYCRQFQDEFMRRVASIPELSHIHAGVNTGNRVFIVGNLSHEFEHQLIDLIYDVHRHNKVPMEVQVDDDEASIAGGCSDGEDILIGRGPLPIAAATVLR
jgi:hypothetical protein